MKAGTILRLTAASLLTATASVAGGQTAPVIPSTADISRTRVPERRAPAAKFELRIESPEASAVPKAVDLIEFEVNDIVIKGVSTYAKSEVDAIFKPLLGTKITLVKLREVTAKLEAKYRADGYFLSRAFIPAQRVRKGVLNVQVIEGYVSDIIIDSEDERLAHRLNKTLKPILSHRPIRLSDVETALLRINDMPGVVASSVLKPGTKTGASELVLTASNAPISVGASLSNTGSAEIGPWTLGTNASISRPFGRTGSLDLTAAVGDQSASEIKSGSVRYTEPLGHAGASVSIGALVAQANPGGSVKALDISSFVTSFTAKVHTPVLRSRQDTLFLDVGLSVNGTKTTTGIAALPADRLLSRDKTTVGEFSLSYQQNGFLNGSTTISAGVFHRFGFFGANTSTTPKPSVIGSDIRFTRLTYSLQRTQFFPKQFSAMFQIQGQYTKDSLVSGELISFGGPAIGRGYDPSLIAGDRGLGGLLELRYDSNFKIDKYFTRPQFYVFADLARATTIANGTNPKNTDSIASVGAGLRFDILKRGHFDVQFSDGLRTINGANGRDPRFTLSASVGF